MKQIKVLMGFIVVFYAFSSGASLCEWLHGSRDKISPHAIEKAKGHFTTGVAQLEAGRYKPAIKDFNKSIKLNFNSADVYLYRGIAYVHLGSTSNYSPYLKAEKDFDQAIKLDPSLHSAYIHRAGINVIFGEMPVTGEMEKAIVNYDKALALKPDDPVTLFNRGVANLNLGWESRYTEAILDFKKVLKLDPQLIKAYIYLGNATLRSWKMDQRGALYISLEDPDVSHDSISRKALVQYGAVSESLKQYKKTINDYKKAIQYFEKALALDPKNAVAYNNIGVANYRLGRYEQAIKAFDQALALDAEEYLTNVRHGAKEEWLRPIKVKTAIVHNNRGSARYELSLIGDAIEDFEKALELDTYLVVARNNLLSIRGGSFFLLDAILGD